MKKIMFNDQYGLTEAVLDGRKTQTRRIAYEKPFKHIRSCGFCTEGKDKGKLIINDGNEIVAKSTYKIGEVVAVAQRYCDIPFANDIFIREVPIGWSNKMFVKSDLMPHQIIITNIRCERLQDISTDDCMKEGIYCCHMVWYHNRYSYDATNDSKRKKWWYDTPIEAYKMLSCKLHFHWDSNPLVFVYDFKLVK
ncbi:hypothetical protein [Segatella copri]|uniref:hypothetical protein n=1 Tax=Segatella copri TaxID=165179 RepID=UPI001C44401D|nr:hypothetical protein [Segatella copri]MBW0045889.1 hypothetical protein [Segatella copri]